MKRIRIILRRVVYTRSSTGLLRREWMLSFLLLFGILRATDYYVDFSGGSDSNAGTSHLLAWKHAPGDADATAGPRNVVLQPEDRILFRGGIVYRGSILIPASGTSGNPIAYIGDGWGVDKAILDGSEIVVSNWRRCQSAGDCGGNPNWMNIWFIDLPQVTDALLANMMQNDEFLYVAQYPSPSNPLFNDNVKEYMIPEPVDQSNPTRTSLVDIKLPGLGGPSLVGLPVIVYTGNNHIMVTKITAYVEGEKKISFDDIRSNPYTGSQARYALLNHILYIDEEGEYTCDPLTHRVYLWPRSGADPNMATITYTTQRNGIKGIGRHFVSIEGFRLQKYSGAQGFDGSAIVFYNHSSNIVIKNNWIEKIRYCNYGGYGGILLQETDHCLVEGNHVQLCPLNRGIFVQIGDSIEVRKNTMLSVGHDFFTGYVCYNSRFTDNRVSSGGMIGGHANGMAFYMGCKNVLIARNTISGCGALTISSTDKTNPADADNFVIYGNVIDPKNDNTISCTLANMSYVREAFILNNTVVNSINNSSIVMASINPLYDGNYITKNNIVDGMYTIGERTHNLYVGLRAIQYPSPWSPSTGEIVDFDGFKYVALDPSTVFIDPVADYNLKLGSRAIDSGIDISNILDTLTTDRTVNPVRQVSIRDLFPGFDWMIDINGNRRNLGNGWDMGACEYVPPGGSTQTISLVVGWNWISFNVLPADRSLGAVFTAILGQVEQVKSQSQSAVYANGQWLGDLVDMDGIQAGMMYKVKVIAACTLTVTGTRIAAATPIQLNAGWNWIAYFPSSPEFIDQALSSIALGVQQAKSQTQSAIYSGGSWLGDLAQLEPGKGYAILANGPGTLIYPQ